MELLETAFVRGTDTTDDFVELTGLDILTGHAPVHGVYFFEGRPDLAKLRESLCATLDLYPAFGSALVRHGQRLFLHRNNTGVCWRVYRARGQLPPMNGLTLSIDESPLVDAGDRTPVFDGVTPPIAIRVTLFEEGGWTLTVRNTHSVVDGAAFSAFMACWSALYRDERPERPCRWERARVGSLAAGAGYRPSAGFRVLPRANFSMSSRLSINRRSHCSVLIELSPGDMENLVARSRTGAGSWPSSSDVLHGLLWKAFAASRPEAGEHVTRLYSAFDIRRLGGLGIPVRFAGNAVIERQAEASFATVRNATVGEVARLYRNQAKPLVEREVREDIAFLQREYAVGNLRGNGAFSNFVRASMVDCLAGNGLFVNDLRFLPAATTTFNQHSLRYEIVPALGFHAAFIYSGPTGEVLLRYVGERATMDAFRREIDTAVA